MDLKELSLKLESLRYVGRGYIIIALILLAVLLIGIVFSWGVYVLDALVGGLVLLCFSLYIKNRYLIKETESLVRRVQAAQEANKAFEEKQKEE